MLLLPEARPAVAGAWWLSLHSDRAGFEALGWVLRFAAADEGARALRGNLVVTVALATAVPAARLPIRRTSGYRAC